MGLFDRITGQFTKGGRDDALLLKGVDLAKANQPADAIKIYDSLLATPATNPSTRARALFNRALAYSSMDDDVRALADLQAVLKLPNLPDNVQSAARSQIARVRKRNEP